MQPLCGLGGSTSAAEGVQSKIEATAQTKRIRLLHKKQTCFLLRLISIDISKQKQRGRFDFLSIDVEAPPCMPRNHIDRDLVAQGLCNHTL